MDNSISNASTELPDIYLSISASYRHVEAEQARQSARELAGELSLNDTANISLSSLADSDLRERSIDRERGPLAFNTITHEPFIEPTTRHLNFSQAVRFEYSMIFEQHKIEELAERAASIIKTNNDPEAECAVCLLSETDCILTCGHQFHYDSCIIPWFFMYNHDSCPYCRKKI